MSDRIEHFIRNYGILAFMLAGALVAYGVLYAQNATTGTKVDQMSTKMDGVSSDVAAIKATMPYVERDISALQDRMRQLEARR